MKTNLLLFLLVIGLTKLSGQNYYKIYFAGNPETVMVENLTQGKSVSLEGTDTLYLKLEGTSVRETEKSKRTLIVYPNPMDYSCHFNFENTSHGIVSIQLYQNNGRLVHEYGRKLPQGMHHFQLLGVPAGVYVIHIKTETCQISGSFVSTYKYTPDILLIHTKETPLKTADDKNGKESGKNKHEDIPVSFRSIVEMDFTTGDQLKFIGYASGSDNDTLYASPTADQTITFTFCPKPAQPSVISGNDHPCQWATGLNYSVTNVAGVTYIWTVPTGWTITSGQNTSSITVTAGSASGSITVTPSNTCGNGPQQNLAVTAQTVPAKPTTGTHEATQTQIVWNWQAVAGATGYKYNTVNNIITTTDNGTSTTFTQTELNCGTQYKLYVWAYNSCGNSSFIMLTQSTEPCTSCGLVTFTYNGSQVTYGTVPGANNRCWLDRNLGALQVATSSADAASYGHLFQWGRPGDGHQLRTSPTTNTLSSSDNPGHGNFILATSSPFDWRSPRNNDLWQGIDGTNNPCPDGYRLPSKVDWETELFSWSSDNTAGAFASPLKLPLAGARNHDNGSPDAEGSYGFYWSSTVFGESVYRFRFNSSGVAINPNYRAGGSSVRCIKDCVVPSMPAAGTHESSQTQIVWNWNAAEGATAYKFNTVNNSATATDNDTSVTYTQTGLTCETLYTLYVWAYNTCGNSTALILTQNTSVCEPECGSPVTFTYNGNTVTYGTVTGANNRCWLDRNLGAAQVATSSTDAASYGDLFQWGRLDDGHQLRTSPNTTTLSSIDVPGHGNYIMVSPVHPYDWRNPQNDNLWQGVNGINNPCPDGYRLPTEKEWEAEHLSWSTNNAAGAFASPLKLPLAGSRNPVDGSVYNEGSSSTYWSSPVKGINSWYLNFGSSHAFMFYIYRAYGFSVRCIKNCVVPSMPADGTHEPSQTQIVWNWNAAEGATAYKYSTINDYSTATDNGTSTSYTQTDLTCETAFTLYVWAYNNCGASMVLTLTQSTSSCTPDCGSPVTFAYNGITVTYGTVTSANNRCWLDRNLGAARVATSSTDPDSYGDLFQWGRLDDGHQVRTSPATTILSSSDNPGHGNFIQAYDYPHDWRSPQNNNLWQGVYGTNNPCPDGYRLPTETEWETERLSWSQNTVGGAFASPLKLTPAGFRQLDNGSLSNVGSLGYYWASTVSDTYSRQLLFSSTYAYFGSLDRAFGLSVRCIKD